MRRSSCADLQGLLRKVSPTDLQEDTDWAGGVGMDKVTQHGRVKAIHNKQPLPGCETGHSCWLFLFVGNSLPVKPG